MSKTPEFLFHYTVGPKLPMIAEAKRLEPRGFGMAQAREKPVLWLSENPMWEPTANKVVSMDQGKTFVRPSMKELHEIVGLYRFRVDTGKLAGMPDRVIKLFPWGRIQGIAHIAPSEAAKMIEAGIRWGATPTHWWGVMEPLALSLIDEGVMQIEQRSAPAPGEGPNVWSRVPFGEALANYLARGQRIRHTTATKTPGARGI